MSCFHLLQEGNHLAGAPFVWFGEVDVFEVEQKAFTVLGAVHTTCVGGDDHTSLAQLLQNVAGAGLCGTVHHGHLSRTQILKGMSEKQAG